MSDISKKTVSIFIDQTAAQVALDKLQQKADQLTKSIAAGQTAGKNMSAEIKKLGDTSTSIQKLQDQLTKGLTPSLQQQENLVKQLRNELRLLSQDAPEAADKLASFQKANAQLKEMKSNLEGVSKAQSGFMSEFKSIAAGVFVGNAVQDAIFGVVNGVKQAISSVIQLNSQFESSVANLSAITGATGQDLEFLKNQAIELSKTGARSATDFVEAFKLIASAKPELLGAKEDLVEVTKAANLLSNASGLELPDAAKRLTDALNQFGAPAKDAAKYVDALAAASKFGAAEVPEITDALLQFGAQAKSSNISIYESSAAIELLAEKGLKGADAGVKLRNVFLALNAVNALDKRAIDALAAAGVNTEILSNKSLSLEDRLKELSKIQNNAADIVKVFGKENFNAAQIVLQNIPRYAELTSQIKEQGVAEQQASVNTNTLSNAWEKFKNVLASRFLTGDNTLLKGLVDSVTKLVAPTKTAKDNFEDLSTKVQHLDKDIVPLAARYDELKAKTNLSTKEQAEMKNIISQIAAAVPSAITQFDAYGNAIAISSTRVQQFIQDQKSLLAVTNKAAIEDTKKQMLDISNQIEILGTKMKQVAQNGFFNVTERDLSQFGAPLINRKSTEEEINQARAQFQELQGQSRGYYLQLMQLNGTALEDQINASKKAVEETTKTTQDIVNDTLDKTDKTKDKAVKNFQEFIKGIDEAILNNQIPEHTKPLIEALRKVADETAKLNDIAKLDKKGNPTAITIEEYVSGNKKILQEYKTFLQRFVEDEAKIFKAPVNASTIADGQITSKPDLPKVDVPLNISTDVTPEEEKALKTKLEKLSKKLKDDQKADDDKKKTQLELVDEITSYAQDALNIIGQLGAVQAANEQRALQREIKGNDIKKASLKSQLDQKLISQQSYQKQISEMDAAVEKKKEDIDRKQFERNKRLQIAQTLMNGAAGEIKLWIDPGFPEAIPLAVALAAQTIASTAVIAAQKFALGGAVLPNGKINASSNIPTQQNGDNVLATVRTGEVILNEQQQAALGGPDTFRRIGVPGFAFGGAVKPGYKSRSYQAIDFAGATRSMQMVKHFASGGVVTSSSSGASISTDPALLELLKSNQEAIETLHFTVGILQGQLSKGITANASISLKKITDAQSQRDRILEDATFK